MMNLTNVRHELIVPLVHREFEPMKNQLFTMKESVIHIERVFDVKGCDRLMPVYSLQQHSKLRWSDPFWRITTIHLFTSTVFV